MNKAKVMLTVLSVFAIIGCAFAFMARGTYGGNLECATSTTTAGAPNIGYVVCTRTYSTTIAPAGTYRHCRSIGSPAGAPCVVQRVTFNQ